MTLEERIAQLEAQVSLQRKLLACAALLLLLFAFLTATVMFASGLNSPGRRGDIEQAR